MIKKTTKCAIKRTAKTVGVTGAGIVVCGGLFIAIAFFFGTLVGIVMEAFPILHSIASFLILMLFISLILFVIIFGIYKEYEKNKDVCNRIAEMKSEEKHG